MKNIFWIRKFLWNIFAQRLGIFIYLMFLLSIAVFLSGFAQLYYGKYFYSLFFIFGGGSMCRDFIRNRFIPIWKKTKENLENIEQFQLFLIKNEKNQLMAVVDKKPKRRQNML